MNTETKPCMCCHTDKPLSEFWRDSRTKDGLDRWCKDCHRENNRTPHRKETFAASYKRNKHHAPAQRKAWQAYNAGKIIKPPKCSQCGCVDSKLEMHHEDYSKPLDVIWVCRPCHYKIHTQPPTEKTKLVNFRVPTAEIPLLKAQAKERGFPNLSEYIRALIQSDS